MTSFDGLRRQEFRRYYQPTRILLGLMDAPVPSGVNVITLCFSMTCSYKQPMIAFAVHKRAWSLQLLKKASDLVLSVPGEGLAHEALYCGIKSGRAVDKVRECGMELTQSASVRCPGLRAAIANIELSIQSMVETGDHTTVIGKVRKYAVNKANHERNLLSVGPTHQGYSVLASKGIHRIGVIAN